MGVLERLTRTHADLEMELAAFAKMLHAIDQHHDARAALEELKAELDAVGDLLELHIAVESRLEERSESVLGEGAMADYEMPAHQERMRAAVAKLHLSLADGRPTAELHRQLQTFLAHFDEYTSAEWQFLRENASVLYPGGAIG